jgi:hypothetical protein
MYHHLLILNGFIDSSIEVLGNSPSDSEGMTALEGVGVAAQRISGNIDEYLENANTPEEFIVNLNFVKKEADYIVSNSTTNPTVQCSSYENQKDCEVAECSWLDSPFPGGTGSCQASQ